MKNIVSPQKWWLSWSLAVCLLICVGSKLSPILFHFYDVYCHCWMTASSFKSVCLFFVMTFHSAFSAVEDPDYQIVLRMIFISFGCSVLPHLWEVNRGIVLRMILVSFGCSVLPLLWEVCGGSHKGHQKSLWCYWHFLVFHDVSHTIFTLFLYTG